MSAPATARTSDRDTTRSLMTRLERHYIKPGPMPGGIFLPECGINGGTQSRVDAVYVGFTTASGRLLVGHEVKVSRADWRRELDKAGKADLWADNCHQWIIVAPGPDVVPAEEIPHGWGLMYPSTRTTTRMQIVVKPVTHAARVPSWKIVRSIVARLDTLQHQQMAGHRAAVAEQERKRADDQLTQRLQARGETRLTPETQHKLQALGRLEQLLGTTLAGRWDKIEGSVTPEVAAAALAIATSLDGGLVLRSPAYVTETLRNDAQRLLDSLEGYDRARDALLALVGPGAER